MPKQTNPSRTSCLGSILIALTLLWLNGIAFVTQGFGWSALAFGVHGNQQVNAGLLQVILSILPLALLAWLWRAPRQRTIFQAWLLAIGYALFLLPTRAFPATRGQAILLLQLALSLFYLAIVWFWASKKFGREKKLARGSSGVWFALAATAVLAAPWLANGALGSALDTLLALALGLTVGITAAVITNFTWFRSLRAESHGRGWDIFTGGITIGGVLLLLGSALAFNGIQLLLMLTLPGLGWLAMALGYATSLVETEQPPEPVFVWQPLALLVGVSIAVTIALTDSDSMSMAAMDSGIGIAFKTAFWSMLLGWLAAIAALLMRKGWGKKFGPALPAGAAGSLWLAALLLYFLAGTPGLYGDRLFIILKEQTDVSQAAAMPDYDARRQFVYHTLTQHAEQSQARLRQTFERFGVDYTPYYLVNAIEADNSLLTRLILLIRSDVDRTIPSPVLRPLAEPLNVSSGDVPAPSAPQWNLTNIGANRVWNELHVRGKGIVIGQSDSGVQGDHPELQDSYRGRNSGNDFNWLDPWTHTAKPVDFGGHGTHTTGSILGKSVGVAPDAEWIACVNLQRNLGNPALYLDCMQFMLAPYPQNGNPFSDGDPLRAAHILNNSWGCPEEMEGCNPTALLPAARALRDAGIFVVVSAGNDGPACSTVSDPLAIYDDVFTVGAVDAYNDLANFSSVGPVTVDGSQRTKPDILAPGVDVLSSSPNSTYSEVSGTSMAGPHLVGVVALMWSANPALIGDIERTEQLLIQTAAPFSGSIAGSIIFNKSAASLEDRTQGTCLAQSDLSATPNNIAGYGVVDAYAAVKAAIEIQ